MSIQRRSGRLAKEVAILLLGTDSSGRVFSEETVTVVLSRHGAGIVSAQRIAGDQMLTVRLIGTSREAEVRLVGQIGQEPRGFIYGVAFTDPETDFWKVTFPAPASADDAAVALQCACCDRQEAIEHNEIEADVYAINENIARFCEVCGSLTLWLPVGAKKTARPKRPRTRSLPANPSAEVAAAETGTIMADPIHTGLTALRPAESAIAVADPHPAAPGSAPSNPEGAQRGKRSRRRSVRARVTFTAYIRDFQSGDELVECDDVSKGGFSFRSPKSYVQDQVIAAAIPYAPGDHIIFVPAKIKHIQPLSNGRTRYGAAYNPVEQRDSR